MYNFSNNSERFITNRGLYIRWVKVEEAGGTVLKATWIDPTRELATGLRDASRHQLEGGETCCGISLQFA
jgi:hypothetical protein